MDIVRPYITHLNALKRDIPRIVREIIRQEAIEIIDVVKYGQLAKGLDSQGAVIGVYTPGTEERAKRGRVRKAKEAGQPYNFQWTGKTFDKMSLKFTGDMTFQVFTKDTKRDILLEEYGEIFDLTEENNDWINEVIIMPRLYAHILNNMFPS